MTSDQLEVKIGANSSLEVLNAHIPKKKLLIFIRSRSESLKKCIPIFWGFYHIQGHPKGGKML